MTARIFCKIIAEKSLKLSCHYDLNEWIKQFKVVHKTLPEFKLAALAIDKNYCSVYFSPLWIENTINISFGQDVISHNEKSTEKKLARVANFQSRGQILCIFACLKNHLSISGDWGVKRDNCRDLTPAIPQGNIKKILYFL